jgi:predicted SprT family Zn-dependent metalloprotease
MDDVKFLLKFGRSEHINSFIEGKLYCSNAETFWGIEDRLKLRGQGDRLEASSMIFAKNVLIQSHDDNSDVARIGRFNGLVRYEPAKKIPVFCLFAILNNECYIDIDGNLKFNLADRTKQVIREHFPNADSVAIISNPSQFLSDIQSSIGYEIKHELVHYYNIYKGFETNDGEQAMDMDYMRYLSQDVLPIVINGTTQYSFCADYVYRALLCKDVYFEDEQEYRIVLPTETIDNGKTYPVKYREEIHMKSIDNFFAEV